MFKRPTEYQMDNTRKKAPWHIRNKNFKAWNKERILKAKKKKEQVNYKFRPIITLYHLQEDSSQKGPRWCVPSSETTKLSAQKLYPTKLHCRTEREEKKSMIKKKTRFYKFRMTKPALQRILERRLQSEVEYRHTQGGCRK